MTENIRSAVEIIDSERANTREERDAFMEFINRVKAIEATAQHAAPRRMLLSHNGGVENVHEVYQETVMDTEHYEDDYGDTVAESIRGEFDAETASLLLTEDCLSPLLKQRVIQNANQSAIEREDFLSTLQEEHGALRNAEATLSEFNGQLDSLQAKSLSEIPTGELIRTYSHFEDVEAECKTLLTKRQQQRTDGHASMEIPGTAVSDLYVYLYQQLSVTYPVLVDTTRYLETVHNTRKRIVSELASRA